MTTPREKFQALFKKLFQFDNAEMDFGIYRIMNHRPGFGDEPDNGHIEAIVTGSA